MSVQHLFAAALLGLGGLLQCFAVLGLVAMRDVYDRLHYVGLAGYGGLLVGLSILVQKSFSLIGDKALATGLVLVLVGPVVVHTTARSFRVREHGDWREGIEAAQEEAR